MKILKYLNLVLVMVLIFSCKKHEIEYNTTTISNVAEFQLHYFVPVTATATNYINRVEINDQLYSNRKAPLTTYNAIPNGSVGRFYTVAPGIVNIKMYQGATDTTLVKVYDQNVTLTVGKQNVFVHDFAKPPVWFDNGYPYIANVTGNTDSVCYIKFYNFLYETAGVPTTLKLQYQYVDPRNATAVVNIGPPVSFGESTGWQQVKVVKAIYNSAGSAVINYRIKLVDAGGVIGADLQIKNTSGTFVNYAEFFTASIGRRYHSILSGMRAAAPAASARIFTAL